MQIPVNRDLDSFKDDFFKGLTLKHTAVSILSVGAGTGLFLFARYVLKMDQAASFYLSLPVILPIAASGFLRIHGMTPFEYLKKRRSVTQKDAYFFIPEALAGDEREPMTPKETKKIFYLDEPEKGGEEPG